jgi:hypothetical protein
LLAADGTPVPIERAQDEAARGVGELPRVAGESWKRLTEELGKSNPTGLALGALGIGLVAGAVLGALLARD